MALLFNYKLDESYTPQKISVRAGTKHADLKDVVHQVVFSEPVGWKRIKLHSVKSECAPHAAPNFALKHC